jgi:hypothetical protein
MWDRDHRWRGKRVGCKEGVTLGVGQSACSCRAFGLKSSLPVGLRRSTLSMAPGPCAGRLDRMHDPAPSHPSTYVVCTTGCNCPELSSLELLAVGVRSAQWAQSLVRWP